MKAIVSVTVDTELLAEARGVGINLSGLFNEALKEKLHKNPTEEEKKAFEEETLFNVKIEVNQKRNLRPDRFKKAVRYLSYLGMPTNTQKDKIIFWTTVLNEMKKETPSEPPKEKEALK